MDTTRRPRTGAFGLIALPLAIVSAVVLAVVVAVFLYACIIWNVVLAVFEAAERLAQRRLLERRPWQENATDLVSLGLSEPERQRGARV